MTDREQDQAEALAEREQSLLEHADLIIRRPVGEEFDPDAIRVVPHIDEDGNLIEDDILDDPIPDQ
jgi:TFIIF-interacting CTD phosphatase-like protein